MCGIFLYCGDVCNVDTLRELFMRTKHRGPDNTQFVVFQVDDTTMVAMGFHRLAINGMHKGAQQPFTDSGCVTICNGEIWNHKQLGTDAQANLVSGSDCEVLPQLYRHIERTSPRYHPHHPFEEMLRAVDGVFGMALYDRHSQHIHVGRDRIGIRSLYYAKTERTPVTTDSSSPGRTSHNLWVASELKSLPPSCQDIRPFPPGCWMSWPVCPQSPSSDTTSGPCPYWSLADMRRMSMPAHRDKYAVALNENARPQESPGYTVCATDIERVLVAAVEKRLMSDRPVGCVLSGGLDSTVVTAIACRLMKRRQSDAPKVRTYTIGLEGAEDLKWARRAAAALGTDHREFVVSEAEFLEAIPEVIRQIESYDVTTVRASVGNWLLAKYIAASGEDTVLLCGDVADELFGGYRGYGLCTNPKAFDEANMRMLADVHRFDVLRCEKSFAGHGLEARVPFADLDVVELTMSLPAEYKMWGTGGQIEKDLLRRAFVDYLPRELLWRRKEAFSDGVSAADNSWFTIIRDALSDDTPSSSTRIQTSHLQPYDTESRVYRQTFDRHYASPNVVPYYWKHPFTTEQDPSARCLTNYKTDTC